MAVFPKKRKFECVLCAIREVCDDYKLGKRYGNKNCYEKNSLIFKGLKIPKTIIILLIMLMPISSYALDASWYSVESLRKDGQWNISHGRMANGELFSDNQYVGASWDYPLGTVVRVTNPVNNKFTVVVIKDRINKRFKGKRIDLSPRAFKELAPLHHGIIKHVKVEVL